MTDLRLYRIVDERPLNPNRNLMIWTASEDEAIELWSEIFRGSPGNAPDVPQDVTEVSTRGLRPGSNAVVWPPNVVRPIPAPRDPADAPMLLYFVEGSGNVETDLDYDFDIFVWARTPQRAIELWRDAHEEVLADEVEDMSKALPTRVRLVNTVPPGEEQAVSWWATGGHPLPVPGGDGLLVVFDLEGGG